MSRDVIINGSPKIKKSIFMMLINQIQEILQEKAIVYQATQVARKEDPSEILTEVLNVETFLLIFPLYVDSLPAPLIKILTGIEQESKKVKGRKPRVYAVCNCGFYEAEHNQVALTILENFSARAGLRWEYGIGIGSGALVYSQRENLSKGPTAAVYKALYELGKAIQEDEAKTQNVFITPKFPRLLYKFVGNRGWHQVAKKYGTEKKLKAKPHVESQEMRRIERK